MNLTNLFGKQVFALYEGEIVGTVVEAIYNTDYTKVISLKIFDNEEVEYEVKLKNINAIDDCIIISNKNKLNIFIGSTKTNPLFKAVIDQQAKHYGKIIDCDIETNGYINYFLTDKDNQLSPTNIYLRNNFVYYSTDKFILKNYRPKQKTKTLDKINVNVLNFVNKNENYNFAPSKLSYNPSILVGKVAKDTLLGLNNEVIIKANQTITQKTLDDATRHNRLNQLYFLAV